MVDICGILIYVHLFVLFQIASDTSALAINSSGEDLRTSC